MAQAPTYLGPPHVKVPEILPTTSTYDTFILATNPPIS